MSIDKNQIVDLIKEKGWSFNELCPLLFSALDAISLPSDLKTNLPFDHTLKMALRYKRIDSNTNLGGSLIGAHSSYLYVDTGCAFLNIIAPNTVCSFKDENTKILQNALKYLSEVDSNLERILKLYVNKFIFFRNGSFRSASHPHIFGLIVLGEDKFDKFNNDLALSIIHELAHQELFLLNLVDRFVNQVSDYSLAHAPYQGTARPPIGRLHSCHALFRMLQYCKALEIPHEIRDKYQFFFNQNVKSLSENELTEFGVKFVKNIYK